MIRFKTEEAGVKRITILSLLAGCAILAGATHGRAQGPDIAQVVALDECDPTTFNAALGADECKNIAAGFSTMLGDLIASAQSGPPFNPGWDFEPNTLTIKQGTVVSAVNQGGEVHTFTEVKAFG